MTEANPSTASETTIPVSSELRDRLRVAKAEDGVAYDTWLRENLQIED